MPLNAYSAGKVLLCGDYSAYCPSGKSLFLRSGRWGTAPKVGSIVYYYYPSLRRVAHVGVVTKVEEEGKTFSFTSIEGNTSGSVNERNGGAVRQKMHRKISHSSVGSGIINGFGYPAYGEHTCTKEEFLAVVNEELGYLEKASNHSLESKTENPGTKNYTKYGAWYGMNGPDAYWCQMFVSWCAYMACKRHRTGWIQRDESWYYIRQGNLIKGSWLQDDDAWYVFDDAGKMIIGWFLDKTVDKTGNYYYLNPANGRMLAKQWLMDRDKWYYLSASGVMGRDAYVYDPKREMYCWLSDTGAWDGKYYPEEAVRGYEVVD